MEKTDLAKKDVWTFFHVTTFSLSNITVTVISSTSKMIGDITYLLLTACLTVQQVNQTFIVAIKIMVYFISFLVKVFFSYFLVVTNPYR